VSLLSATGAPSFVRGCGCDEHQQRLLRCSIVILVISYLREGNDASYRETGSAHQVVHGRAPLAEGLLAAGAADGNDNASSPPASRPLTFR